MNYFSHIKNNIIYLKYTLISGKLLIILLIINIPNKINVNLERLIMTFIVK